MEYKTKNKQNKQNKNKFTDKQQIGVTRGEGGGVRAKWKKGFKYGVMDENKTFCGKHA